jgi:hypothetical protein
MDSLPNLWRNFKISRDCSVDRMICSPELRNAFLEFVRSATGKADEETILWDLMALRKRGGL